MNYDSYKVKPQCMLTGECSNECPYTHECWGDLENEEEDEEID